jgi:hypothetical protein
MINLNFIRLDHSGGTKFYEAAVLSCEATGQALTMFRWGSTDGRVDQGIGASCDSIRDAVKDLRSKVKQKEKRGYKAGIRYDESFDEVSGDIDAFEKWLVERVGNKFRYHAKLRGEIVDWTGQQFNAAADQVILEDDQTDYPPSPSPSVVARQEAEQRLAAEDDAWGIF